VRSLGDRHQTSSEELVDIWNNFEPDDAVLLDGKGVEVSRWVDGK